MEPGEIGLKYSAGLIPPGSHFILQEGQHLVINIQPNDIVPGLG
jgi:hypothetical protein